MVRNAGLRFAEGESTFWESRNEKLEFGWKEIEVVEGEWKKEKKLTDW